MQAVSYTHLDVYKRQDWCRGFAEGADRITELNEGVVAEGTAEKVAEVEAAIIDGSLKVFDTSTWTVDGETLDTYVDVYKRQKYRIVNTGFAL